MIYIITIIFLLGFNRRFRLCFFYIAASLLSTPLSSVVVGVSEANSLVAFEESSAVTLAGNLSVDAESAGTYDSNGSLATATIPSDTVVGSYLVHFDPEGTTTTSRSGTITFERDILGVIALNTSLDASDSVLGSPTTTYPASGTDTYRGYDLASNEFFRIAEDGRSVHLVVIAAGGTDQVRIVLDNTP